MYAVDKNVVAGYRCKLKIEGSGEIPASKIKGTYERSKVPFSFELCVLLIFIVPFCKYDPDHISNTERGCCWKWYKISCRRCLT